MTKKKIYGANLCPDTDREWAGIGLWRSKVQLWFPLKQAHVVLLPCPAMADGHGLCGVAALPQSLHYTATSVWSHGKACIGHPPQVSAWHCGPGKSSIQCILVKGASSISIVQSFLLWKYTLSLEIHSISIVTILLLFKRCSNLILLFPKNNFESLLFMSVILFSLLRVLCQVFCTSSSSRGVRISQLVFTRTSMYVWYEKDRSWSVACHTMGASSRQPH
jgi:hypothetical protein